MQPNLLEFIILLLSSFYDAVLVHSSYVPAPATFLHQVDARIKQVRTIVRWMSCGYDERNCIFQEILPFSSHPATLHFTFVVVVAGSAILYDCPSDPNPSHWRCLYHRFAYNHGVPTSLVAVSGAFGGLHACQAITIHFFL